MYTTPKQTQQHSQIGTWDRISPTNEQILTTNMYTPFLFTCTGGKVLLLILVGGAREARHFSKFNFQALCRAAGDLNLSYYRQQRRKLIRDKIDGHPMVSPVSLVISSG